jgi:hypothetical protein
MSPLFLIEKKFYPDFRTKSGEPFFAALSSIKEYVTTSQDFRNDRRALTFSKEAL